MWPGTAPPAQGVLTGGPSHPLNLEVPAAPTAREGCIPAARKALRAGAEKMSMVLSSSAAQKRLDILEGGGLQGLEE